MAKTGTTTVSRWRTRWASRLNERRQRTYDAAAAAWRHRDDELRRMRTLAADYHGSAAAAEGLPVRLHPDEIVFCVLPAAQLVEARHLTTLPAPDLTVEPAPLGGRHRRPADGIKVTDAGTAVVTDRRVLFQGGRGRREWAYAKMTGLAHDAAAPVTLMQVLNRKEISGLLLPPAAAPRFRFHLTLAFADTIEQRETVLAQLDELIAAHESARPEEPAAVRSDQAPLTALVPGGRFAVAAAVAVALLIPAAVFQSDPPVRTQPEAATAGTPLATRSAATATPTPRPTPAPTARPKKKPTAVAATQSPRPKRTRTANLCGAPANPYGYNYCGGSRIYDAASRVCYYFRCVTNFDAGRGYLILCRDGRVSMTGGRPEACANNGGKRRTIYDA